MKNGFSLVELSIVLVILGLLVGGILTGQNLIRAAELRNIPLEFEKYQSAENLFKDKYFALPGDMPNATSFWGRADDGTFSDQCASPSTDIGTGTQTCNGNGSGLNDTNNEQFRLWQHLANAGLWEGTFTGVGIANPMEIGGNAPRMKLSNVTMRAPKRFTMYSNPPKVAIRFGLPSSEFGNDGGFLTPEEAWGVDMKMDDGKADTGNVISTCGSQAAYWASPNCLACTTGHWAQPSGDYILSEDTASCVLAIAL